MSKASALMKTAQVEKTRQTVQRLVEWFATKQEFYQTYLPIQQSIIKQVIHATQFTVARLKHIALIIKEEREMQAVVYERCEKNALSNCIIFNPKEEQVTNSQGQKVKVQFPSWSSNIDRIFLSLGKRQHDKQMQAKKAYKTLQSVHEAIVKQENRYKGEIKKCEKDILGLFDKIDESEKEESKILGKLIKDSKNEQTKDSCHFIGQLKKIECLVMSEAVTFSNRGLKISQLLKVVLKLQKQVAKVIKDSMKIYLNYRKSYLGIDPKMEEEIYGQVSLSEEKIDQERISYFNKVILKKQQVILLSKLIGGQELNNPWEITLKFLEAPHSAIIDHMKAQKQLLYFLKNISFRCWQGVYLAQGWLIESYTPSVMYMTYDYMTLIYSRQGQFLKKIHTASSKISKIEGNTIFLQQKTKGFFTNGLEQYKVRFQEIQRLEEFQLFMENQIK